MNKLLKHFLNNPRLIDIVDEINSDIKFKRKGKITRKNFLYLLFSSDDYKEFLKNITLGELFEGEFPIGDTKFGTYMTNYIKSYPNSIWIFKRDLFILTLDFIDSINQLFDSEEFYGFYRNLPASFVRILVFARCSNNDESFLFVHQLLNNILSKNELNDEMIDIFSAPTSYEIVRNILFPGFEDYDQESLRMVHSIYFDYLLEAPDVYNIFMETFNNYARFGQLLFTFGIKYLKNDSLPAFDMVKFCELSDPELPFEWNLELHLEESINN